MPTKSVTHTWTGRYARYEGQLAPGVVSFSTAQAALTDYLTGVENPKWRQQVQNVQNATTPMTAERWSVTRRRGHMSIAFRWDPVLGFNSTKRVEQWARGHIASNQHLTALPVIDGAWTSTADARARAKAFQEIRKLQVQFSGPIALGELRETIRMLRKPAGALGQKCWSYVDRVKKLKGRPGSEPWNKAVSQAWLEAQFGWKPLMRDIEEATEAYNDVLDSGEVVLKFSVGAGDGKRTQDIQDTFLAVAGSYLRHIRYRSTDHGHYVRYRGAVSNELFPNTTIYDRAARWGFTPSEFFPTAWELLPWSFLADYFANIGDIITAAATSTVGLRWVNKSDIRTVTARYLLTPDLAWARSILGKAWLGGTGQSSTSWITRSRVVRSSGISLTIPELTFTVPDLERSPIKWLNIAALLNQARGVHPQRTSGRNYRL